MSCRKSIWCVYFHTIYPLFLTRDCFELGIWGPVDFSQCTLTDDLVGNLGILSLVMTGVTVSEIEGNRTNLEAEVQLSSLFGQLAKPIIQGLILKNILFSTQMRNILDSSNVTYTSVNTTAVYSASVAIGFLVDFSPKNNLQFMVIVSTIEISKEFGGYSVLSTDFSIIESAGM